MRAYLFVVYAFFSSALGQGPNTLLLIRHHEQTKGRFNWADINLTVFAFLNIFLFLFEDSPKALLCRFHEKLTMVYFRLPEHGGQWSELPRVALLDPVRPGLPALGQPLPSPSSIWIPVDTWKQLQVVQTRVSE